ncbi:MAG: hypothetical protein AAF253_04855 [Pseudomonadota bacterium]
MDYSALPLVLARVHPLHWPVLLMNLLAVSMYLHANGIRGASLKVWANGRVEIDRLWERAESRCDPETQLQGLLALTGRNQQTASAALLCDPAPSDGMGADGAASLAQAPARTLETVRAVWTSAIATLAGRLDRAIVSAQAVGAHRAARPALHPP